MNASKPIGLGAIFCSFLRQVRKLNIKKVDDKPMVIHTKEKAKLHIKQEPEAKIKGRNILVVERSPKIARANTEGAADSKKVARKGNPDQINHKEGSVVKEEVRKSVQKENGVYTQYHKSKQDRGKKISKKNGTVGSVTSVGAKATLDQMECGNEVYGFYMVAKNLPRLVESATDAGRRLYRLQSAKAQAKRIKKVQAGRKIGKKAAKDSAAKAAKETTKAAGIAMDRKDVKNSTRNRMIQLFIAKLRQEENQDSIGKALKDIVLMRFSVMAKYIIRYVGLFLLVLFALVALMALPIIAVIAIIYNSPFAIFFPSISSGETTQNVLSAYVAEFNGDVNSELTNHSGYDTSEKIYVDFEGAGSPDNYYDILAVYMVKYGDGDTATDMTDKAKENLKEVFDDMCSYSISSRTDTDTDDEGNTTTTTVKEVNVELKTYRDMISEYGFNAEEQEILEELMKPEYLAMIGYTGGGGDPGETLSSEQYQVIVDAISDANGKKVVEYALSKVGYPYSQAYRDSGEYYDCSSLAYYAWQNAGVNIMYEGANTAAAEGKFCYDNNYLVNYEEMQPGDLIFYSYSNNGRFFNITHVAIYVGDGKVVEAANEKIGVVYRSVQTRSSIVFIGRPR